MSGRQITPHKALNKAYRKVKPIRKDIDAFKANLINLLDRINETESEEIHKNLIRDFLKNTYYDPDHFINTKGRSDLVIHNSKKAKSPVGVLIEAKKPSEVYAMTQPGKLNVKAMQELVLYYLRERLIEKNDGVRHLIVTNIYEWYVFDAQVFDKCFAQDKKLVKKFKDFEAGRLSFKSTDQFYKEIASPAIDAAVNQLEYTYFDIRKYDKPLRNENPRDDNKLVVLYKIFSPQHLLKLPFANDSNSLDKAFYSELLHIIGLDEVKEKGKKLIKRKKKGHRDAASLLENTINKLDSLGKLSRISNIQQYGSDREEQLFAIGLELVITWINRILFLKLLEAQLLSYHRGDKKYRFLDIQTLPDFDQVEKLFFSVLARKTEDRSEDVKEKFHHIPYLNSSLFEPQTLEHDGLFISQLEDNKTLPIHNRTVLKDNSKKKSGQLNALQYLFDFLNAYDFSSEGSEEIQEENKNLINASVLGLIFEKINGYKDGSFFTPGFITMYMCRETIRRAVVQKFNDRLGWKCQTFEDLREDLNDYVRNHSEGRKAARLNANDIINDLKICDPAVGSGHFLVSSLNEIIAIKHELHILQDREGNLLNDYHIEVENDELIITNELQADTPLYEYHPENKESQRVQEALFHEKQTIIENCLFGVDINPNSVKICQLRLWIELLKNAYYTGKNELETLPNIDINIKCGNSLISRFDLDADLSTVFSKKGYSKQDYLTAVEAYKEVNDKDAKRELREYIDGIKQEFKTTLYARDPRKTKLSKLRGQLNLLENKEAIGDLFGKLDDKDLSKNKKKLEKQIIKLETELQQEEDGKFYDDHQAFEWRFEFPEVLDDDGNYQGFDVVIGNPPYIRIQDLNKDINQVQWLNKKYESTGSGNYDLYIPFIELGFNIMDDKGYHCYIMPHKFINANYGKNIRSLISENQYLYKFIDFKHHQVFEDATTYTGLFFFTKENQNTINYSACEEFDNFYALDFSNISYSYIEADKWKFLPENKAKLVQKITRLFPALDQVTDRIFQGLKTSADKIYIVKLIEEFEDSYHVYSRQNDKIFEVEKFLFHKLIKGGNSASYLIEHEDLLILFPYKNGELINAKEIENSAPNTWNYLIKNKTYLELRENSKFKGENWYQFGRNQAIDVIVEPKIFTPDIAPNPRISLDKEGEFYFTGGVAGGYGIIPKRELDFNYLLAILNSNVAFWYLKNISTQMRGGWYSFESRYIKQIPIPENNNRSVIRLSKKIQQLKSQNQDTSALEAEIDLLVYKLYGLTYDEVKVVDEEFGMSAEEYESYHV